MYIFRLLFVLGLLQHLQPVCKGVQNLKMDPAATSAGSKRKYSSDKAFKIFLICQLCKNDPLYKLTAVGLDNFKTAIDEQRIIYMTDCII